MTIPTTGLIGGPLRAMTARAARTTSGARRIVVFTALLTALAVFLAAVTLPHDAPAVPPLAIPWLFLAGLFYVAEAKVIHLHIGRSAHSFSMSEIPVVIGLCCFAPVAFITARLIGSGLALVVGRHQRSVKLAFNLAQFALCSVVSVAIVSAVGNPAHDLGPRLWAAIFAATVVENLISTLSVSIAISLTEATPTYRRILEMVRIGMLVSMTNTSLALMGLTVFWSNPGAAWLLVVPTVAAAIAYRAYISDRQRHEALEMLHESTLILQRTPDIDAALVALLGHTRAMFRADIAEICLLPRRPGDAILRTSAGPGAATTVMERIGPTFADPVLACAVSDRRARLIEGRRYRRPWCPDRGAIA